MRTALGGSAPASAPWWCWSSIAWRSSWLCTTPSAWLPPPGDRASLHLSAKTKTPSKHHHFYHQPLFLGTQHLKINTFANQLFTRTKNQVTLSEMVLGFLDQPRIKTRTGLIRISTLFLFVFKLFLGGAVFVIYLF